MIKKILNSKLHLRFTFNPLIRFLSNSLGNYSGITLEKREVPVIVSLTSYDERFSDLEITLYSLVNQKIKPDRIILWLDKERYTLNNLPYIITKYLKNGLEIRFVEDIRSYTKIYYALKEFLDSIIVTADDDIFYPKYWLERLYYSYISNPQNIHCHRAHRLILENQEIMPYETWIKHAKEESARFDNFLTGVGGVLYPPNCFSSEVLRKDIFLKYAPTADDIWLWIMAVVNNRKIRIVKNHIKTLTCVDLIGQLGIKNKKTLYSINSKGANDKQLKSLLDFYGQNVINNIKKDSVK